MSSSGLQSPLNRRRVLRGIGAAAAGGTLAARGLRGAPARAAAQGDVTLTVFDGFNRPVESQVVDTLNEEFAASHPGVTIERTVRSFDDLKATARLAMSADDGPDACQINQGWSDMGAMVEAGVLRDLGPYAAQYGWNQKLAPGVVARNSFSPDGAAFGEGSLFGLPVTAELIGIFYHREKFAAAGAAVPATFGELETLLRSFKDAGEIPIAFGNLDAWPALHTYGELQNLYVDRQYLDDFVFGRGGAGFATPENEQAAAKLRGWTEAGYFTPDFSGIGYDASWQGWASGQGVTLLTGSWLGGELPGEDPGRFGFFLTPPETAGAPKPSVAGTSMAFAIREGSPNADLAAEYLDWLVSPRAVELWTAAGVVHIGVDAAAVEPGTLFADLVGAWTRLNETDTVGHYLDWATPTFYDTMTAGLQELLGGAVEPPAFVARVQEDYAAYLAEKAAT